MRKRVGVMTLAAAGALAFGGTYAKAADIGVTPTKLIVVDKLAASSSAKAVFVAKDANVTKGTGTDPADISAVLDIDYDNGVNPPISGQFLAPQGVSWLVNKSTVAKYVNKTAPTGGDTKVSVIKPGKLVKLVGKGLGDTPLNILSQSGAEGGTATTSYCVTNGGEENCFLSILDTCVWKSIAGDTGAKLVCKGGQAVGATTTSTTLPCGGDAGPCLKFVTTAPTGTCGTVREAGTSGTIRKSLGCGGLNVGGGNSTVAESPTPAGAPTVFNISGGPTTFTVSGRTAAQTLNPNNCSDTGCQFGPFLPIENSGTSTCVQNKFASPASGTVDTAAGTFNGAIPLSSQVYLTGNDVSPCPKCIAGACDPTWVSSAAEAGQDPGDPCTALDANGDNYECRPSAGSILGVPFPVPLNPITTGTVSKFAASGVFCPPNPPVGGVGQQTAGAFGCKVAASLLCPSPNGLMVDYMDENGSPAGAISSTPAAATLASLFCIPSVGGIVDIAANLPGPGATSLPGTFAVLP